MYMSVVRTVKDVPRKQVTIGEAFSMRTSRVVGEHARRKLSRR